jgi:lipoate-protein ligase B
MPWFPDFVAAVELARRGQHQARRAQPVTMIIRVGEVTVYGPGQLVVTLWAVILTRTHCGLGPAKPG